MVWYGMVWYGMVRYGMVWYGMVWSGMVWSGMVYLPALSWNWETTISTGDSIPGPSGAELRRYQRLSAILRDYQGRSGATAIRGHDSGLGAGVGGKGGV